MNYMPLEDISNGSNQQDESLPYNNSIEETQCLIDDVKGSDEANINIEASKWTELANIVAGVCVVMSEAGGGGNFSQVTMRLAKPLWKCDLHVQIVMAAVWSCQMLTATAMRRDERAEHLRSYMNVLHSLHHSPEGVLVLVYGWYRDMLLQEVFCIFSKDVKSYECQAINKNDTNALFEKCI